MARQKTPYRTDVPIRFQHPTDVIAQNPLDFTTDGSTCTFKVFDPAKDEVLTAAEITSATVLNVTGAGVFEIGDTVEVDLDDGTVHDAGAVTAVDPVAGTIDVTTGLASGAAAGRRVRVRLGAQVTMTEYGTPTLGRTDWGFIGILSNTHLGLEIGLEIDVEISFVGAVVGGLDALDVLCLVVRPLADCAESC